MMKFSSCCLFLSVVGFSNGSSSLLSAFSKAFKKFSLLGSVGGGPPTTPPPPSRSSHIPWISHAPTPTSPPTYPPPELKCDVIWEEKVTPLCKTVQEKICKTDEKDHCHKIWEDKCWDEPVEDCHPKEECNHVLENVCKTEYTVACDKEHGGGGGVDEYEAAGGLDRHRRAIQGLFPALGGIRGGVVEPQPEPEPEPTTPNPHEELCHHHPETTCWDEPVEKCETILECTLDVKNLCKKVPKEVCEQVSVENCWDEPSEKCEYMMVKVARKHCRDLHEKPKH